MNNILSHVALVDPQVLLRQSLAQVINSLGPYSVAAEVSNADEALTSVDRLGADIILVLELALPGKSGIEVLHELHRRNLPIKTLVLSSELPEATIKQSLSAGALSYVSKMSTVDEFTYALERTSAGQRFLPPELSHLENVTAQPLLRQISKDSSSSDDPISLLSNREREIFFLLADGLQNKTIAKKLFISPRTVETHRTRIVHKLNVVSNTELLRFAIKHGLSIL